MKNLDKVNNSFLQAETRRDLIILLLLSAILKAILALFIGVINHDGVLYITAAQKLAGGAFKEALAIYGIPFYPLLIALVHYVVPNWVAAARLVSIVASTFTIIPLYLLTKEMFSRQAAMWACAAFALLPLSNHLSVEVIRDPLFLFFLAWAIYFAHLAINSKKLLHFLLSSLFCSFSIFCRIEGLVLYLFYILFTFCLSLGRPKERASLLKGILIYIAPVLLLIIINSLILSADWSTTFKTNSEIILEIKRLFNLGFLENYKLTYNQLKNFETTMPGKAKVQNFIEIVIHYMPIIYLLGLLESFIKALFPIYLIPLVVGLWHSRNRNGAFILLLAGCYLLMDFYYLIRMDSIRVRFLFAPAFLFHPWIGFGLDRLYSYVRVSSRRRLFTVLLVILFALLPVYRSFTITWKQDDILLKAGKWIANVPQFKAAGIITTDRRVPFYAGRGLDFFFYPDPDYLKMETFAARSEMDLLIIKTSKRKKNHTPRFKKYRKVEEFVGVKDIVSIYCSPKLYKSISGKKL
jgi:4-amino-4-deoxy-L-arabinose transferase-like glycosyltransferase